MVTSRSCVFPRGRQAPDRARTGTFACHKLQVEVDSARVQTGPTGHRLPQAAPQAGCASVLACPHSWFPRGLL